MKRRSSSYTGQRRSSLLRSLSAPLESEPTQREGKKIGGMKTSTSWKSIGAGPLSEPPGTSKAWGATINDAFEPGH